MARYLKCLLLSLPLTLSVALLSCGTTPGSMPPPQTPTPPAGPEVLYGAPAESLLNTFFTATINPATGGLSSLSVGTTPVLSSSGMVAVDAQFLYISTSLLNDGQIFGYAINSATGAVTPLAGSPFAPSAGVPLQGFVTPPNSHLIYASGEGQIYAFTADNATGALLALPGSPFSSGVGAQLVVDPSGKFLYATSSSHPTQILAFAVSTTGTLTPLSGSPFAIPGQTNAGSNPVGILDTGKYVYITLDGPNQIAAFSLNGTTGALTSVPGSPFETEESPSVLATASGFLYTVNVEDGSISGYSINAASGALAPVSGSPFETDCVTLAADSSGKYLYASRTVGIQGYNVNASTGQLTQGAAGVSDDGSLWLTIVQLPSSAPQ